MGESKLNLKSDRSLGIALCLALLAPIVVLMATLSIGGILNADFDQIFNSYSPLVYKTGDIIDTWVYRAGLLDME